MAAAVGVCAVGEGECLVDRVGVAEGGGYFVTGVGEGFDEEAALVGEWWLEERGAVEDAGALGGELDGEGEAGGGAALAAAGSGQKLVDGERGEALASFVGGGEVGAALPGIVDQLGERVEDGASVFEVVDLCAGDAMGVEGDDAIVFVEGEGEGGVVVDGSGDDGVEVGEDGGQVRGGVGVEADLGGIREAGEDLFDCD